LRDFGPNRRHAERPAEASFKVVHGPPARKERLSAIDAAVTPEPAAASKIQCAEKTYISAKPRFGVSESPPRGTN
jgi:hypothetical protein